MNHKSGTEFWFFNFIRVIRGIRGLIVFQQCRLNFDEDNLMRIALGIVVLLTPSISWAQPAIAPPVKYADALTRLDDFIEREIGDKKIPALAYAIVDDQTIIRARAFGHSKRDKSKAADADTVFRVGSVSKLFTDIAIMQLVEKGELDLDAPIQKYLPNFKPTNPFDKPITLRMMMAHRSGLVREPPVGNYFDDTQPSLANSVKSLNSTKLVYQPESKLKYSNAAIGTVGYVLEVTQKQPFEKLIQERVLGPLGMKHSSFTPTKEVKESLAEALMWSYHGREFAAPTFELGVGPAGCMYSTVHDLGKFMSAIFADGKGILKPASLKEMLTPQFSAKGARRSFGLGFVLGELDGHKAVGHGGAIYGFATDLIFLPEEKIGIVVIASRDVANSLASRFSQYGLRLTLAVKHAKELPKIEPTTPFTPAEARALAGRYKSGDKLVDFVDSAGRLWMFSSNNVLRMEYRKSGNDLMSDDLQGFGQKIERVGDKLRIGKDVYERVPDAKPAECPAHFRGLIGEYGWDHNILYIFEKDGKLHALIEWTEIDALKEIDKDTFAFSEDLGMYIGEKLVFKRDASGKATQVEAASVVFKRRPIDGEDGRTFTIKPQKPVEQLRKEAAAAKPPEERGDFVDSDLTDLALLDPTIKFDLRYATSNSFLSTPLYPANAKAYMQRPAAAALVKVHQKLKEQGFGLLIHDSYRPWAVTKMFWDATEPKFRHFVADPSKGSRHNRGCAVDLTLYDLKTGKPIEMVGGYDEFSDRSFPDYIGGTHQQRWHRDLLRHAMESAGFTVYEMEWWHFDYQDWRKYRIGNKTFEELAK